MESQLDLVGIGAVNRDFIVRWHHIEEARRPELRRQLLDLERTTNDLDAFVADLSPVLQTAEQVTRTYGGSAFNVVRAVAQLSPTLRVGYVSALGRAPIEAEAARWPPLAHSVPHVELAGVRETSGSTGACLSLVDDQGNRELHTYYSDAVAEAIADPEFEHGADYLRRARHIHVSSVLGKGGPAAVLRLLERSHDPGSGVTLSVDPGLPWAELVSTGGGDDVLEIIRRADYVFANAEELKRLGASSDLERAAHNLAGSGGGATVVLLKDWDRTVIVRGDGSTDVVRLSALPPCRIADSTGGGDVFAAGFLSALLDYRLAEVGTALTGMIAARTKLQAFGDRGFDRLRTEFTKHHDDPGGVFISYEAGDVRLARAFVNLLESTGVPISRIFCINVDGAGVPPGEEWLPAVAYRLQRARLVISLVTPKFLRSSFCDYETGAAWILGKQNWCLVDRRVSMSKLGPLRSPAQATRLDDVDGLRRLREHVERIGCGPALAADWDRPIRAFLDACDPEPPKD